ncbi:hypothetical protein [Kitasatospora sp. NPDC092286]|uniref:hypothetical protein n=1 Tax=Kitasatospora sp. NPDC092286 TaxID=3364087 RepID=UPI0038001649
MTATAERTPDNHAPWVVTRAGERMLDQRLVLTARGVAFPDETPFDRDDHGVLWTRWGGRPVGRPQMANVHSLRQRRAMRQLLCQGCKQPADRNQNGTLWLIEDDRAGAEVDWPERQMTMHPPTCRPCADRSRRLCPHLRRTGSVLLRVRTPEIAGVRGYLCQQDGDFLVRAKTVELEYIDPQRHLVVAVHQLMSLEGCQIIDTRAAARTDTIPRTRQP